jgi:hypothetical protein
MNREIHQTSTKHPPNIKQPSIHNAAAFGSSTTTPSSACYVLQPHALVAMLYIQCRSSTTKCLKQRLRHAAKHEHVNTHWFKLPTHTKDPLHISSRRPGLHQCIHFISKPLTLDHLRILAGSTSSTTHL